ncbi:MAG: ribosome recycling factor [Candidatus Nanopelagicales bacterium]
MIDDILLECEEKMEKAIAVAREDFATLRTGRVNPAMFSKILVDYYGAPTPLNQLASFHAADARMMLITPFDRNSVNAVEKAIRDSDLGVNPSTDGNVVRVVLPQLTEERRKEYIKVARHKAEEARVSIRNIRRQAKEALEKLKKDGDAGEDEVKRSLAHLEEITHEQVAHVDEVLKHKEEELLEV